MNLGHSIGSAVRDAVREQPARGFWHEVGSVSIERVRTVVERLDLIRYEAWETQDDERTCEICGPLDGTTWVAGEGFSPPIHDHCRCRREYHHTEFRRREIEAWRDIAVPRSSWEWVRSAF